MGGKSPGVLEKGTMCWRIILCVLEFLIWSLKIKKNKWSYTITSVEVLLLYMEWETGKLLTVKAGNISGSSNSKHKNEYRWGKQL